MIPVAGMFFFFTIGLALTGFWIWCIVDIIRGEFKRENDKILWLVLVLLVPFIGSILYLYMGKEQKVEKHEDIV